MANAFDRSDYPLREPDQLVIGDRWMWKRQLSDYPATAYTLSYQARTQSTTPERLNITAVADGADHIVEVASTATTAFEPGAYTWFAFITRNSDSERIELLRGAWTVKPDAATDNSDPRTLAARMVSKLAATIEALSSQSVISYSLGERSVTKRDLPELRRELQYWQNVRETEIAAERIARGLSPRRSIRARFR